MSHKKSDRQVWPHRFNLSSDNSDDVRLHDFLKSLAGDGEASAWIRKGLSALVPQLHNTGTTVVPQYKVTRGKPIPVPDEELTDDSDVARYVDIDTGA